MAAILLFEIIDLSTVAAAAALLVQAICWQSAGVRTSRFSARAGFAPHVKVARPFGR
jgi:hypothetical protein